MMVRPHNVGRSVFALGLFSLALIGAATSRFIPGLQPASSLSGLPGLATFNAAVMLLLSAGLFSARFRRHSALVLACYFMAWIVAAHVLPGLSGEADVTAVVAFAQLAAITALLLTIGAHGKGPAFVGAAQIVSGAMLVVFGLVHYHYHGFISSMIPAWIPAPKVWPWVTGSVNLAAGLTMITGYRARTGGAIVGAMFASWIPIVHAPRILAQPHSADEWSGAALALTLAGAVWLVAENANKKPAPTIGPQFT